MRKILTPLRFRPLFKLTPSASHPPPLVVADDPDRCWTPPPAEKPAPVALWLRELRRDKREQVL